MVSLIFQKQQEMFFLISALASKFKKLSNQKIKGTLLCEITPN